MWFKAFHSYFQWGAEMHSRAKQILQENLKRFRKLAGYTQEEVANRLGVSLQTVARWESGARLPSIDYLEKLADLYGVEVADFFIEPTDMYNESHIKNLIRKLRSLKRLEPKKRERVLKLLEEQLDVLVGV